MMAESRCGVLCSRCGRREAVYCKGCTEMALPFWGAPCGVKSCCEEKGLPHCGVCAVFPCGMLSTMGAEEGYDPAPRLMQCQMWADDEKSE